jgi:hypothetical protein
MMMPERIARLPRDKRGYPIPWNVLRADDGTPFFTVNDDRQHFEALRLDLCPLCGERIGRWHWWVGGPKAAFDEHGWYLDLPGHRDCIRFALETCPYLAMPHYIPNRIDVPDLSRLLPEQRILIDQSMDHGRPSLFVAVCADRAELSDNGPVALPYTRPVRPVAEYEFWRHGQQIPAHRAMPILRGIFGADWEPPGKDVI